MSVVPPGGGGSSFAGLGPLSFTQQGGGAYAARACVKIDGQLYTLKSYSLQKNAHGATNTGSFVVTYADKPDWTDQLFQDTFGAGGNSKPVYVEIWAGFPDNPGTLPTTTGLSRRFYGVLDVYDPDDISTTEFHIRSIASPLTTDRITTNIQNITTTKFLQQIAAPYSIPVVIDPALTQPFTLAQVYAGEFLVGLHNLIKWDVGLRSTWFDDCDIWEDDGTLYYVHPWNVSSVMASQPSNGRIYTPLTLTYGTDVMNFKPSHAPQFSRNIRVTVSSYRAKTRVSISNLIQSVVGGVAVSQNIRTSVASPDWGVNGGTTTTYYNDGSPTKVSHWSSFGGSSSGSNAPIGESSLETYHFYVPNLSPEQCQQLSLALWRQISMHEYQGKITLAVTPANLPYLNIENRFVVRGYPMSRFNTEYWPRQMDETFDMAEENSGDAGGWEVTMTAVNHTPPLGSV